MSMSAESRAAFKHALFEGAVEFNYTKSDGTPRHAHGTMNEALLPKAEPMATFKCTEIEWHSESQWPNDQKLRKTVRLPEAVADSLTTDELEKRLTDLVREACSDGDKRPGYASSFCYERVEKKDKPKKDLPEDSVFYYDLDKKAYRSFKIGKLQDWKLM